MTGDSACQTTSGNTRPMSWYEHWWVWTIAGVVVAAGAGVGIFIGVQSNASLEGGVGGGTVDNTFVITDGLRR